MAHTRRDYDKAYRRIQVYSSSTPNFEEFTTEKQVITYSNDQVLEILRDDGRTELFCGNRARAQVFYCPHGMDQIRIQVHGQCPRLSEITARMWAKKGNSILYKLPPVAKCVGNCVYIMTPGGSTGVELFGDTYFDQFFELTNQ